MGGEFLKGKPAMNWWKCFTVSPGKILYKFTNKTGEITGESPVKLVHQLTIGAAKFIQFPHTN